MTDATLTLVTEPAGAGYPPGSAPEPDSGLVGLVMLARFHNIAADADQLAHDFREPGQRFGVPQILLAAKQLGLKAKKVAT
jgi:subfamily B ATP-binding cassette protein HlyB/CyaB